MTKIDDKRQHILNLLQKKNDDPYNKQLLVQFIQEGVDYFLDINLEKHQQHFLCSHKYVNIVVELFPALVVEEKNFIIFRNLLESHLTKCFDCVEAIYIGIKELYKRYKAIYVTDSEIKNTEIFFESLRKWQIKRIKASLTKVAKFKGKINTNTYGNSSSSSYEIYLPIIFDLLLNSKYFQNSNINELFTSILTFLQQQGSFFKLTYRYLPGMLLSALHENQEVRQWAWTSFQTINYELRVKEFKFYEFDVVMNGALQKLVNFGDKQGSKYPFTKNIVEFWKGFRKILSRLENEILYDDSCLKYDIKEIFYTHWKNCTYNQGPLLIELLKALNILLKKLGQDLWTNHGHWKIKILDVFESSNFHVLTITHSKKKFLLAWIQPYIISIISSNTFLTILEKVLDILMKESQKSDCDDGYRIVCYDMILMIVLQTLSKNGLVHYTFYRNYASRSSKFRTLFDNVMLRFSYEDINRNMRSLGMSGMKETLLKKLKEVQRGRNVKYPKRQVRLIETPQNNTKDHWMERFQRQKDNEARLTPNLNPLYKKILSFEFTISSEIPPDTYLRDYETIPTTFSSARHYVQIFEPLLILECWHLCNSKKKVNDHAKFVIFVNDICMVDDFIDVSFHCEEHDLNRLSENDLLYIRYEPSEKDSVQYNIPLIQSIAIFKNQKFLLHLNESSHNVRRFLFKGSKWMAHRIMSLTSIIREYAALIAMHKFSLKGQILSPRASIVSSSAQKIKFYKNNYHINEHQAEIIGNILENDCGFSLIQGPPGSGKSEMIISLISALRDSSNFQGKILVCAPSDSAINILLNKFKDGTGNDIRVNIICLGDSVPNLNVSLDFWAEKMMFDIKGNSSRDLLYYRRKVLEKADVICSTLIESGNEILSTTDIYFNTIIIDDATQAIELSSLIPLKYNPKRVILIGDPRQLPPVISSKFVMQFSYDKSLFARIQKNSPSSTNQLTIQYRMHPEISKFPSQFFYDSLIKDADCLLQKRNQPWHQGQFFSPYRFFDVNEIIIENDLTCDNAEAKIIAKACKRLIKDFHQVDFDGQIGIIVSDKDQKFNILREFTRDTVIELEIDTLDTFQGREKDIIILSCFCPCKENNIGFLNDSKGLNVALTRAKCSLWIFGSSNTLVHNDSWKSLIEDAKNRGCYTEASEGMFYVVEENDDVFDEISLSMEEDEDDMFIEIQDDDMSSILEDSEKIVELKDNMENDEPNDRLTLPSGVFARLNDSVPTGEVSRYFSHPPDHSHCDWRPVHHQRHFQINDNYKNHYQNPYNYRNHFPIDDNHRQRVNNSRRNKYPRVERESTERSRSPIKNDVQDNKRDRSSSPEEGPSRHRRFHNERNYNRT
ncbi:2652_t:CDS:2 [Funneliformis caledonium]|uniref:2652_t:CDS:1 n=1 Tax=Funneliformis caledonium TaxID=1117310 RepID=A0A9N8VGS4_9GLOM|nr:2652_t:CDS:2 [Funneliformis caledonium]